MISNANDPLISVVVPVYNTSQYLEGCLNSIIRQTYHNLEIVLVDDGSTDSSGEICDSFARMDPRFCVYHKRNGGLSDSRNYGIAKSHGEYIVFVDSDDIVDADLVEYLYELLLKYHTDLSICQHKVHFASGKVIDYGSGKQDEKISQKECFRRFLYDNGIDTSAWGKLYRKSLFDDIQYPCGQIFEDLATTYKLINRCDFVAVGNLSKYNYMLHGNSIVNGSFSTQKLTYSKIADAVIVDIVKKYPDLKKAGIARRVRARFTALNMIIESKTKDYHAEEQKMCRFIKKYSKVVLKDAEVSRQEKVAIILVNINYSLYKTARMILRKGAIQ